MKEDFLKQIKLKCWSSRKSTKIVLQKNYCTWRITGADALKILKSIHNENIEEGSYVTYSENVENCGSHVIKTLGACGISVSKTLSFMPKLIKGEVKASAKSKSSHLIAEKD